VGALLYRVSDRGKTFRRRIDRHHSPAVVEQDPAFPKLINPHIPEELGVLCTKAMAKDPSSVIKPAGNAGCLSGHPASGIGRGIHHPGRPKNHTAPPSAPVRQRTRKPPVQESASYPQASSTPSEPSAWKRLKLFHRPSLPFRKNLFPSRRRPRKKAGKGNQSPKSGSKIIWIGSIFFVLILALILVIIQLVKNPGAT